MYSRHPPGWLLVILKRAGGSQKLRDGLRAVRSWRSRSKEAVVLEIVPSIV